MYHFLLFFVRVRDKWSFIDVALAQTQLRSSPATSSAGGALVENALDPQKSVETSCRFSVNEVLFFRNFLKMSFIICE